MFDDLAAVYHNQVLEAFGAYEACLNLNVAGRENHTRLAIDAATVLFHFREHFPTQHRKTRAEVTNSCPDYRLVADVANAAKHSELTRSTSDGPPLVAKAEDIEETTIVTRYEDAQGEYSDVRIVVSVECTDGKRRSLDRALHHVLNFWGEELERIGIISSHRRREPPEPPGSYYVPRSNAMGDLDLVILKGVRWRQSVQLLKFDQSYGRSTPVDLTGADVQFRIFEPPSYELDLMFDAQVKEEPIKVSLPLTRAESEAYAALETDSARGNFVKDLADRRRDEIQQLHLRDAATSKPAQE